METTNSLDEMTDRSLIAEENEVLMNDIKRSEELLEVAQNERDDLRTKFSIMQQQLMSFVHDNESDESEASSTISASELLHQNFDLRRKLNDVQLSYKKQLFIHEINQSGLSKLVDKFKSNMLSQRSKYIEMEKELSNRSDALESEAHSADQKLKAISMDLKTALGCLEDEQKSSKELRLVTKSLREQLDAATDINKNLNDEIFQLTAAWKNTKQVFDEKEEEWESDEKNFHSFYAKERKNVLELWKSIKIFKQEFLHIKSHTKHDLKMMKSQLSFLSSKLSSSCTILCNDQSAQENMSLHMVKTKFDSYLMMQSNYERDKVETSGRIHQLGAENERLHSLVDEKIEYISVLKDNLDSEKEINEERLKKLDEQLSVSRQTQDLLNIFHSCIKEIAQIILKSSENSNLDNSFNKSQLHLSFSSLSPSKISIFNDSNLYIQNFTHYKTFAQSTMTSVGEEFSQNIVKISKLEEKLEEYQNEVKSLKDNINNLSDSKKETQIRNTTLELTCGELKNEAALLQQERENLLNRNAGLSAEKSALMNEKNIAESLNDSLKHEKTSLQNSCSNLKNRLQDLQNKYEEIKDANSKFNLESEQKQHRISNLEKEMSNVNNKLLMEEKKLIFKEQTIEDLEKDRISLRSKISNLEVENSKLEEQKLQIENELSKLQAKLDSIDAENKILKQHNSDVDEEYLKLKNENISIVKKVEQLHDKKKNFEDKIKTIESEKNLLEEKTSELNETIDSLQTELNLLQKELSSLKLEKSKIEDDLHSSSHRNNMTSKELDDIRMELKKEKTFSQKMKELNAELTRERNKLENNVSVLQNDLTSYQSMYESLRENKANLDTHLSECEQSKNITEINSKKLEVENDRLQSLIKSLKDEVKEIKKECSDFKDKLELTNKSHSEEMNQLNSNHSKKIQIITEDKNECILNLNTGYETKLDLLAKEKEDILRKLQTEITLLESKNYDMHHEFDEKMKHFETIKLKELNVSNHERNQLTISLRKSEEKCFSLQQELNTMKLKITEIEEKNKNEVTSLNFDLKEYGEKNSELLIKHEEDVKKFKGELVNCNNEISLLKSSLLKTSEELSNKNKLHDSASRNEEERLIIIKKLQKSELNLKNELQQSRSDLNSANSTLNSQCNEVEAYKISCKKLKEDIESRNNSIDCLEKQLKTLRTDHSVLKSNLEESRETLKEVEKSRLDTRKNLMELKRKFFDLETENKRRNHEFEEIKLLKTQDLNMLKSSEDQLRELKQKLLQQEAMNEKLRKELSIYKSRLSEVENNMALRCKDLEISLKESREIEQKVHSDNKNLEKEVEVLNNSLSTLHLQLESANDKLKITSESLQCIEENKKDLEASCYEMESSLRSILGVNVSKSLKMSGNSLSINPDSLHATLHEYMLKVNNTEAEKEYLRKQVHSLENNLCRLDSEKNSFSVKYFDANKTLCDLKNENKILNAQVYDAKKALELQENIVRDLRNENSTLSKKSNKLQNKLTSVNSENQYHKEGLRKLKEVENKLTEELSGQRSACQQAESLMTEIKSVNDTLREEKNRLRSSNEDKTTEIQVLKERINSMNNLTSELEEKNMILDVTVNRLKISLEKSSAGHTQLKDQVLDLNKSLSENTASAEKSRIKRLDIQSALKTSEEEKLAMYEELQSLKKRNSEFEMKKTFGNSEINHLKLEMRTKDNRITILEKDLFNMQKSLNSKLEDEQTLNMKMKYLKNDKNELEEKLLTMQRELKSVEVDKKIVQKSVSMLEKDKKTLKKTLIQMEKENTANLNKSLPNELEKFQLQQINQDLKVQMQEMEQLYQQQLLNLKMGHKDDLNRCNKRLASSQEYFESILDSREKSHRERIVGLENQIQILREQLQEEVKRRRLYISKKLQTGSEIKDIRSTVYSSLNNVSSLDSEIFRNEISRLDGTVDNVILSTKCPIKTPSPARFKSHDQKATLNARKHSTPVRDSPRNTKRNLFQ